MKTQDSEPEKDAFQCRCTACVNFWGRNFKGHVDKLSLPAVDRAAETSVMYASCKAKEDHPAVLKIGDRVLIKGKLKGKVKYVGILNENTVYPETYVGVQLDDQVHSTHNGVFNGKRYFHCPPGHGCMARYADVVRINPPEPRPPVRGNEMYPSYEQIKKRRQQRSLIDPTFNLGVPYSPNKKPGKVFIADENDIAAKDLVRQAERAKKYELQREQQREKRKQIADARSAETVQQWKSNFGGGKKGEKLAKTLQKLYMAYEKGMKERKEEEEEWSEDEADKSFRSRSPSVGRAKSAGSRGKSSYHTKYK